MSVDVLKQLRSYGSHFEAGLPDFDVEDVTVPGVEPAAVRPPIRRTRPWLVAAAASVTITLAIGGLMLLIYGDNSGGDVVDEPTTVTTAAVDQTTVPTTQSPPTTTAAPTTAAPSTTAAAAATLPAGAEGPMPQLPTSWTRIDTDMTARSVAAGPAGFVAIDPHFQGLIWSSVDGTTWTSQDLGELGFTDVVYGDSGYVAFGGSWDIDIRLSTDGAQWVAADHVDDGTNHESPSGDPAPGYTYGEISGIAHGDGRYVGVGHAREYVHSDEGVYHTNPRAAVWTSADGRTWTRLPENDEVFNGPWHQEMYDVVYGDAGFVAVGSSEGDDGSSSVGAIWHSPEGASWTRIPHDDALFGEQVEGYWYGVSDVAYGADGYVATGPEVLVSADGLTWTAVRDESFEPSSDSVGVGWCDVTYGDGVYLLVGAEWFLDPDVPDPQDPDRLLLKAAVWYSTDAMTWTRVTGTDVLDEILLGGDGPGPSAVAFSEGRFVIVGHEVTWPDHPYGGPVVVGHVWIGEPGE